MTREDRNRANQALFERLRNGDDKAKDELVMLNQPLITTVFNRIYSHSLKQEAEDIFEAGQLGLLNAIMTYDTEKGCTFATLAYECIKNEMIDAIRTVRKRGQPATVISLYTSIKAEYGDNLILMDTLEEHEKGYDEVESGETIAILKNLAKQKLSPQQYEILDVRYFSCDEKINGTQAAKKLGKSKQGSCKLEHRAIEHLRSCYYSLTKDENLLKKFGSESLLEYPVKHFKEKMKNEDVLTKLKPYLKVGLTYRQRYVIEGKFYTDPSKTNAEMAQTLNVSPKTINNFENAALKKLKKLYDNLENCED